MDFVNWVDYFKSNENNFAHLKWVDEDQLSLAEKSVLADSIRQFQKGESSEGWHLLYAADEYANQHQDPSYRESIKLFIREEQKHAMVLGKFMQICGIPKLKSHWLDSIFRKLRKYANHQYTIYILLTAELIASVYYIALGNASKSKLLKSICAQILEDEAFHINFQAYTLKKVHESQGKAYTALGLAFQTLLLSLTIRVVWLDHKKVLQNGGFTFSRFKSMVYFEYSRALNIMNAPSFLSILPKPYYMVKH